MKKLDTIKSSGREREVGTIIIIYDIHNKAYKVEFGDGEGMVKYQGVYLSNQISKLK
ncbi:hypothetical protein [Lysinibacillus odysseyi]|uniref:hypothetical protein n=1 Tax=Lysinibacillus odysseyi TaxID=202611 RepID=UPI000B08B966|nr:hypothetical protein [Lysinibacillus odysseyi]